MPRSSIIQLVTVIHNNNKDIDTDASICSYQNYLMTHIREIFVQETKNLISLQYRTYET